MVKQNDLVFNVNDLYKLKNMNPSAPTLYELPKIHKEGNHIRPVVSYVNAPSYKICKQLNKIILDITNFK